MFYDIKRILYNRIFYQKYLNLRIQIQRAFVHVLIAQYRNRTRLLRERPPPNPHPFRLLWTALLFVIYIDAVTANLFTGAAGKCSSVISRVRYMSHRVMDHCIHTKYYF